MSVGEPRYVVQCNGLEMGMKRTYGEMPTQAPFAVVVGCSDARVPTEMLFGQGFNDLFVIRVAGNVLDDACLGSVDYALSSLSHSVRVVVMLGHSGCGCRDRGRRCLFAAFEVLVEGGHTHAARSITQRIFVAVREAANGIKDVWGPDAREMPGFRRTLIETAVCLNAAQAAFACARTSNGTRVGRSRCSTGCTISGITRFVCRSIPPPLLPTSMSTFATAPTNPKEFYALAVQMAQILKPGAAASSSPATASTNGSGGRSLDRSTTDPEAS